MQKVEDGATTTPVYRAVDWEPYEISMVPIGADAGAVTRSAGGMTPCEFIEERDMPDPPETRPPRPPRRRRRRSAGAAPTADVPCRGEKAERERVLGIQRAAARSEAPAGRDRRRDREGPSSLEAFRAAASTRVANAAPEQGGVIVIDKRDGRDPGGEDSATSGCAARERG
jgi:hypothetical protein